LGRVLKRVGGVLWLYVGLVGLASCHKINEYDVLLLPGCENSMVVVGLLLGKEKKRTPKGFSLSCC